MMKLPAILSLCFSFVLPSLLYAAPGKVLVKNNDTVAFLGDSITAAGFNQSRGYVRLVAAGLKANGIEIKAIGAGVSGHKSNQMLERLEKDVISKTPDWMTLSCGVNDVWHGNRGVKLEDYKKNITEIVDRVQAAGIKPMILTATMIHEDARNEQNQKLVGYNQFLRDLAKERKLPLADLNEMMQEQVKSYQSANKGMKRTPLTNDGVHMLTAGNMMMATGVLKAFGLNNEQMEKAKESWKEIQYDFRNSVKVPLVQLYSLEHLTPEAEEKMSKELAEVIQKYAESGEKIPTK